MLDSNYLIIDRKPQRFTDMKVAGRTVVFLDETGRMLDYGAGVVDGTIYAAMCCDEVRNVTFVRDRDGRQSVITMLWYTEDGYREGKAVFERLLGRRFSPQNLKLNRYAEAIAEKLSNGVRLRVTDAVDEKEMVKCPECGMLNPAGSMFCMECGAEIPQNGEE